jgi:hypothetical protein
MPIGGWLLCLVLVCWCSLRPMFLRSLGPLVPLALRRVCSVAAYAACWLHMCRRRAGGGFYCELGSSPLPAFRPLWIWQAAICRCTRVAKRSGGLLGVCRGGLQLLLWCRCRLLLELVAFYHASCVMQAYCSISVDCSRIPAGALTDCCNQPGCLGVRCSCSRAGSSECRASTGSFARSRLQSTLAPSFLSVGRLK